jgi:hypothetical protein
MIFLCILFHPLLSFTTFTSVSPFFYIPEDSSLMQFSVLLLFLCLTNSWCFHIMFATHVIKIWRGSHVNFVKVLFFIWHGLIPGVFSPEFVSSVCCFRLACLVHLNFLDFITLVVLANLYSHTAWSCYLYNVLNSLIYLNTHTSVCVIYFHLTNFSFQMFSCSLKVWIFFGWHSVSIYCNTKPLDCN